jgi:hypothetical protein
MRLNHTMARMIGHSDGAGCWCILCRNPHPKAETKRQERRRIKRRERQKWKSNEA